MLLNDIDLINLEANIANKKEWKNDLLKEIEYNPDYALTLVAFNHHTGDYE